MGANEVVGWGLWVFLWDILAHFLVFHGFFGFFLNFNQTHQTEPTYLLLFFGIYGMYLGLTGIFLIKPQITLMNADS